MGMATAVRRRRITRPLLLRLGHDHPDHIGPRIAIGVLVAVGARHCDTGEHAYYRCYAPQPVPLRELVRVAGRRWTIEESFQTAKGLARLDEHQVRRWTSWQRWTLLAMIAHALLAVIAATEPPTATATAGLIALNCNEVRRLLLSFARPAPTFACPLAWSRWRRHHQHHARTSHYHRRGHTYEPA